MRTSEVAAQAQVNPETLRYYERRGLLPRPQRSTAGYRTYTWEAVRIVRFIKRAQHLGFALDDVESLLQLAAGGPDSCDAVHEMATDKIADLQSRIADLQSMHAALTQLVATCAQPRQQRQCPILAQVSDDELGSP